MIEDSNYFLDENVKSESKRETLDKRNTENMQSERVSSQLLAEKHKKLWLITFLIRTTGKELQWRMNASWSSSLENKKKTLR